MLDLSVAYNRFRFLGCEFLTWLWYSIEKDTLPEIPGTEETREVRLGNRLVLENMSSKEKIAISGEDADLSEGKLALKKGSLVTEMQAILVIGDDEYRFTIKGFSLHITGLKLPSPRMLQTGEDFEGAALERAFFLEKLFLAIDSLYESFLKERLGDNWSRKVDEIRMWLD